MCRYRRLTLYCSAAFLFTSGAKDSIVPLNTRHSPQVTWVAAIDDDDDDDDGGDDDDDDDDDGGDDDDDSGRCYDYANPRWSWLVTCVQMESERRRIVAAGGIVEQDEMDEFNGTEGAWRVSRLQYLLLQSQSQS